MVLEEKLKVIETENDLNSYIEKLPAKTQLRFPSMTSTSGEYGVCNIVWDQINDTVVILPYRHKRFSKLFQKDENENPATLARLCLLSEVGLDTDIQDPPKQIGGIFEKEDSDISSKKTKFLKYTMLITLFRGVLRTATEIINDKNMEPTWIKRELLKNIFEAKFEKDGKIFGHPQKYAYDRFVDHEKMSERW